MTALVLVVVLAAVSVAPGICHHRGAACVRMHGRHLRDEKTGD